MSDTRTAETTASQTMVWLLIEEAESGSFVDGTTYCVLGAYGSEEAADAARLKAREDHQFGEVADDEWCLCCGSGWTLEHVELSR